MKFAMRIFLPVILAVSVSFAAAGYYMIATLHTSGMNSEVEAAVAENRSARFTMESALQGLSTEEESMKTRQLHELYSSIARSQAAGNTFRVYGQDGDVVFEKEPTPTADAAFACSADTQTRIYRQEAAGNQFFIRVVCHAQWQEASIFVETARDVTMLFEQRSRMLMLFQRIMLGMLLFDALIIFLIAQLTTRPIRRLTKITQQLAWGDLHQRTNLHRRDEIGLLAANFDHMADEIELRIHELEDLNARQEDFIASFAHELKTPMTSMIGYADMLRSKDLPPEDRFLSANYIFTEGKRLESLSIKMMELIVLKKKDFPFKRVQATRLFSDIQAFLQPRMAEANIHFHVSAQKAILMVEPELFRTLLLNLLDNARKACPENGGLIYLEGRVVGESYCVYIRDNGIGISAENLPRITEAFYMADKSRSRKKGGAGLGLAICSEIIRLHNGNIHFKSTPGKGTLVEIILAEAFVLGKGERHADR